MTHPTEEEQFDQEECAALGHEFEIVDKGGGDFQPADPAIRECILCGFLEQSA